MVTMNEPHTITDHDVPGVASLACEAVKFRPNGTEYRNCPEYGGTRVTVPVGRSLAFVLGSPVPASSRTLIPTVTEDGMLRMELSYR